MLLRAIVISSATLLVALACQDGGSTSNGTAPLSTETPADAGAPTAPPTLPSQTGEGSRDCGSGDIDDVERLEAALLTADDLPEDMRGAESALIPLELGDIGDERFAAVVQEEQFLGGHNAAFFTPGFLSTGNGAVYSSIIAVFDDAEIASLLIENPYVGAATTEEAVTFDTIGDESAGLSYEVSLPVAPELAGHVLQFRAGRIVLYVGLASSEQQGSFEEVEQRALLMCARLANLA